MLVFVNVNFPFCGVRSFCGAAVLPDDDTGIKHHRHLPNPSRGVCAPPVAPSVVSGHMAAACDIAEKVKLAGGRRPTHGNWGPAPPSRLQAPRLVLLVRLATAVGRDAEATAGE